MLFPYGRHATPHVDHRHRLRNLFAGQQQMNQRVREPYVTDEFRSGICNRMLEYWRSKCHGDTCPLLTDFDLMDVYDIARFATICDAVDDGREFVARFFGSGIVSVFGFDRTGQTIAESFPQERVPMIIKRYALPRRTGKPVRVVGYLTAVGKEFPFAFEGIYLPLRDRDGNIEHVISAYKFDYEPVDADEIEY